jgi:hypothetical protein
MMNQRIFGYSRIRVFALVCWWSALTGSRHAVVAKNTTSTKDTNNATAAAPSKIQSTVPSSPKWSSNPPVPTMPSRKPASYPYSSSPMVPTRNSTTTQVNRAKSDAPSAVPTVVPSSQSPTSAPTPVCHDLSKYRSPLNNRTCSDHIGTDCIQWRYLGLNASEVEALVNSCPVSCGVECGRFAGFDVEVTFLVENVHNYLSPESDAVMEQVGVEYLTNYASREHPDSSIFVYEAELLSQDVVMLAISSNNDTSIVESSSHQASTETMGGEVGTTKPEIVHLMVTIVYRGYGIDIQHENATAFIVEGINSLGYTRAIQRSGDPELVDVIVTTNLEEALLNRTSTIPDTEQDQEETAPNGVTSATIAGVTVICVLFVCAAFLGVVWYKRLGRYPSGSATTMSSAAAEQVVPQHEDLASDLNSPAHSQKSSFSNVPTLSFEQMLRLVSSASPKGPKADDDNTTRTPSEHPETDLENPAHEECELRHAFNDANSDGSSSSESDPSEHPLAGIIPPMIVIDNIEQYLEQEHGNDDQREKQRVRNVVPTRHVDATPDFVAALAMGTKGDVTNSNNPSLFVSEDLGTPSHANAAPAVGEPVVAHRETDESGSVLQTVMAQPVVDSSQERNRRRLVIDDRVIHLVSGPLSSLDNESPVSKLSRSSGTGSSSQHDKERLSRHKRSISEASTVVAGSERAEETDAWDDTKAIQPAGSSSTPSDSNQGNIFSALWSRSPARRARGKPSPAVEDEPSHRLSGHKRSASKSSSASSSDYDMADNEYEVVLQAPRTGKLGLVIRVIPCAEGLGPIVVQVKDYSPLLGQVYPRDRIVNIDGIRTTNMSLSEVTGMLPGRQTSRWATPVRLVVVRTRRSDDSFAEMEHPLFSRHGSDDCSSSARTPNSAQHPAPFHKNASMHNS